MSLYQGHARVGNVNCVCMIYSVYVVRREDKWAVLLSDACGNKKAPHWDILKYIIYVQ